MKRGRDSFPWIDRILTDSRIGNLYGSFLQVANEFDENVDDLVSFDDAVVKRGHE